MPAESQAVPVTILLTGVTGFVGKVVLEELMRQRNEGIIQFNRVLVPIRSIRGQTAMERFLGKVVKSPCFSKLPTGWHKDVTVLPGDLMEPDCGVNASSLEEMRRKVTHIIHCAGCVSFDSPIEVLLAENVTASLNIVQLAQKCRNLKRLVATSTAYVTPNTKGPI
ncbi:hypothetical protein VMCG_07177 [Cytospora schulzeri]|uniref:Fatty acyl-CoA reductase n=1 Tax=Cytospora schulzeri TaxID=448051 RepID=A0A423W4T0_9PEZI|nr:hypothetical protein VMCG_07177 [Valsa malicola]